MSARLPERRAPKRVRERFPVLVVNGAVREDGSTEKMVRALATGFRSAGARVRTVNLRNLRIADCLGCRQCRDDRHCHYLDEMNPLRAEFLNSSLIVFASPLYFCAVTALMKSFLDRLYFFYQDVNRHLVAGKKVLILTTLGESRPGYETRPLNEFYRRFMRALRLQCVGQKDYPDLMEEDDIRRHPEYLKDARQYGESLIRRLFRSADIRK
jgi:multimeric flavodoxin WrbA